MCQKFIFFVLLLFPFKGFCDRGIITAASSAYLPNLCRSIAYLRNDLGCTLPIEVWHADELNWSAQKQLLRFPGVVVRNLMERVNSRAAVFFRGWQIKAFILQATDFDEVILMDADVFFLKNPEILFNTNGYKETGTYFFRDRNCFTVPYDVSPIKNLYIKRRGSLEYYSAQRSFIRGLIEAPSEYVPSDWRHYWSDTLPTNENPIFTEKQEAGCVVLDKRRHVEGLQEVVKLNANKHEVYRFVYGDKETYWLGLEMAKEPYHLNEEYAASVMNDGKFASYVIQMFEGEMFYVQKFPPLLNPKAYRLFYPARKEFFTLKEISRWNALSHKLWEYS